MRWEHLIETQIWWLKTQTQCNAQLCRKESNLLLLKLALQWPVRVQVTMAAVAAHCREKETLLRYLTPSTCPGTDQCEQQRKPHKEMESHRFAHRVAGEGEMRGLRVIKKTRVAIFWLFCLKSGKNSLQLQRMELRLPFLSVQLTDEEVALRLPAVMQTVDEWVLELPLQERTHTHTHTKTNTKVV